MKNLNLDNEEQNLLDSYEQDEWVSSSDLANELQQYRRYAAETLARDRTISVRLATPDLEVIQQQAHTAGVSYQTFIANILHNFVRGRLVEQV